MTSDQTPIPVASVPIIDRVPHKARHAAALRRKMAIKPKVKEKKHRQKKSRQDRRRSTMKPTSGHVSSRPNRHASKRTKVERYA